MHDELIRVAPLAGLLTFKLAPWSFEVFATTTGLGTTFTTTVRVIDWVHTHTTDSWTDAQPAGATSLAADHIHVFGVSDHTNRGVAISVDLADFTGGQFHESVITFAVVQGHGLTSCPCDATTTTADQFHVVDAGSQWDVAERESVAKIWSNLRTGSELGPHLQALRGQNVGEGAVFIFQKGDSGGAVWIILDSNNNRRTILLVALEIDHAVFLLMATADVAHGDDTLIVPTTGALAHLEEGFFGFGLGDFVETWQRLVTVDRSDWSKGFERHGKVLRL